MKILKGKRTIIIGAAISVLALFDQYARDIVPEQYEGLALFLSGVAMIYLRTITNTPVGKSEGPGGPEVAGFVGPKGDADA